MNSSGPITRSPSSTVSTRRASRYDSGSSGSASAASISPSAASWPSLRALPTSPSAMPDAVRRIANSISTSSRFQPRTLPTALKNSAQKITQVTSLTAMTQHLHPEGAPVRERVGERRPHDPRDPHPPTTCSRRSPSVNTPTASTSETASQASWLGDQPRVEVARRRCAPARRPSPPTAARAPRRRSPPAAAPAAAAGRRRGTPASTTGTTSSGRRAARTRCRRTRAAPRSTPCSPAAPPAAPPRPRRWSAARRRSAAATAPPGSAAAAHPHQRLAELGRHPQADDADGRSICTATVPEPISSPTSSMVRVRGPRCAAWAAAMYQISAITS